MKDFLKKTAEHSGFFAGASTVVLFFGFDNIEAWAQEKVTEQVSNRVDALETKLDKSIEENRKQTDEIKNLLLNMSLRGLPAATAEPAIETDVSEE